MRCFFIYRQFYLDNKSKKFLYDSSYLYSEKLKKRIDVLNELIQNIDKNRPLRLSLPGVFSELPVPPFLVKEWRTLS